MKHYLILLLAGLAGAHADVTLPAVFSDHMVLQQEAGIPVWGWASPGEHVSVALGSGSASATADAEGRWRVELPPAKAEARPQTLIVTGRNAIHFEDVLIGEIWVCSGQSNMEFGIGRTENSKQEIANANDPGIRLFTVGKETALGPVDRLKGAWTPCTSGTIGRQGTWDGFSATAYFFGRELRRRLQVPVGLIQAAVGGTPAEAWTSREGLERLSPDFDHALAGLAQVKQSVEAGAYNREQLLGDWYAENKLDPAISTLGFDASGWKTMRKLPHLWGRNDDPALADFRGAVWLRKEIELPAEAAGKEGVLRFGPLDDGDVTWVNGTRVGASMGLTPRTYKIPAGLLRAGRNVIATWLLNTEGGGGMTGKPEEISLTIEGAGSLPLAGDWQFQIMAPIEQIPPRLFAIAGNASWPTELFNGMIAPLTPFRIRGVAWYQGEANVERAWQYRKLLPAMISDWRAHWRQGDFPFLVVQLANFGPGPGAKPADSALAELREAQALTAETLPNIGLVTAVDIGEPVDLHPKNKQEVGRRLALTACARVYGQAVAFSGPVFKLIRTEGSAIRVAFDYADGLHAKDESPLKGFAVAGKDGVFHWADARIDGHEVVLTSPEVAHPAAARYDWCPSPKGNLVNEAGLPAFPFRTDDRNRK